MLILTVILLAYPTLTISMFCVEILAASFLAQNRVLQKSSQRTSLPPNISIAVIVPAHNEETVIKETLQAIVLQLKVNDRLIVVADNCNDNTENIAKDLGAIVLPRINNVQRGKGYALDFGIQFLKKSPPQVIIIIDADCKISENTIPELANQAILKNKPIQAAYKMIAPISPSIHQKISEFAFIVKNIARPTGMKVLNIPCHLTGSGMAFPWSIAETLNLANGNIVEDMNLGANLVKNNHGPYFFEKSIVTSIFPKNVNAQQSQRKRWEHGHIDSTLKLAPNLFLHGLITKNFKIIFFAIDLCIPPLSLFTLIIAIFLITAFSIGVLLNNITLIWYSLFLSFMYLFSSFLAWKKFGNHILSVNDLLKIPSYLMKKVPLYLNFFSNKESKWIKTKRDNSSSNNNDTN